MPDLTSSTAKADTLQPKIYIIRGQRVLLDRDLAELYGIPTKSLKQAVRRNPDRFPEDFMYVLTKEEFTNWRSQFVTSNSDKMGLRYPPMAFTEQGVAMLSSVLNSPHAIQVNIAIMRTFVKLRALIDTHTELAQKLAEMEDSLHDHDEKINLIFEAISELLAAPITAGKPIGFHVLE